MPLPHSHHPCELLGSSYMSWLDNAGINVSPKVVVRHNPADGFHVVSVSRFDKGEEFIRVPLSSCIDLSPEQDSVLPLLHRGYPPVCLSALVLMRHLYTSGGILGEDHRQLLLALPSPQTVLYWGETEKALLKGTSLENASASLPLARRYREEIRPHLATLLSAAAATQPAAGTGKRRRAEGVDSAPTSASSGESPAAFPPQVLDETKFLHACSLVMSRCFSPPAAPTVKGLPHIPLSAGPYYVPVACFLNHHPLFKMTQLVYVPEEKGGEDGEDAATSLSSRKSAAGNASSKRAKKTNSSSSSSSSSTLLSSSSSLLASSSSSSSSSSSGSFLFAASRNGEEGEQIFAHYGHLSDAALLQSYGYVSDADGDETAAAAAAAAASDADEDGGSSEDACIWPTSNPYNTVTLPLATVLRAAIQTAFGVSLEGTAATAPVALPQGKKGSKHRAQLFQASLKLLDSCGLSFGASVEASRFIEECSRAGLATASTASSSSSSLSSSFSSSSGKKKSGAVAASRAATASSSSSTTASSAASPYSSSYFLLQLQEDKYSRSDEDAEHDHEALTLPVASARTKGAKATAASSKATAASSKATAASSKATLASANSAASGGASSSAKKSSASSTKFSASSASPVPSSTAMVADTPEEDAGGLDSSLAPLSLQLAVEDALSSSPHNLLHCLIPDSLHTSLQFLLCEDNAALEEAEATVSDARTSHLGPLSFPMETVTEYIQSLAARHDNEEEEEEDQEDHVGEALMIHWQTILSAITQALEGYPTSLDQDEKWWAGVRALILDSPSADEEASAHKATAHTAKNTSAASSSGGGGASSSHEGKKRGLASKSSSSEAPVSSASVSASPLPSPSTDPWSLPHKEQVKLGHTDFLYRCCRLVAMREKQMLLSLAKATILELQQAEPDDDSDEDDDDESGEE